MVSNVLVDSKYRTGLGVAFYDRESELDGLEKRLAAYRTLVVYGGRGVGKSELVRYYLARRRGGRVAVVDARERRVRELVPGKPSGERLLRGLMEALGVPTSLLDVVLEVSRAVAGVELVFVDEFHLLYRSLEEALAGLEAVAGYLAKRVEGLPRLLVTVSEGFMATVDAMARLQGYSTGFMLVEPLPLEAFTMLYREYSGRYGCRLGYKLVLGLAGTSPGYLPELCDIEEGEMLIEWVRVRQAQLSHAMYRASVELGVPVREALRAAVRLLEGARPGNPGEHLLGQLLVRENVAYPCMGLQRYQPQLPLYQVTMRIAAERGVMPDEVPPREVLAAAEAQAEVLAGRRCGSLVEARYWP